MTIAGEFRQRAFFEAHRYGGDAWVFVRELLQNSRDAGARKVEITVERRDGRDRIVCRDDGCGMSFEHARKFLFTLYASSKQGQNDAAGRFGIGFWAVLRFKPDQIVVRSAPEGEPGWRIRLSGDLEDMERDTTSIDAGTEIELVRDADGADPAEAVWQAVRRDARHLRRRDSNGEILEVWVNRRRATDEIALPAPSLVFDRSGLRGAVALTDHPRVDLLAHGLRVRTTATLDELLTQPDRPRGRRQGTPEGLVPRVILDSRRLRVLMARGDARTDRELRRLVALGRRAIRLLVRDQLDQEAGLGPVGRAGMRCLEFASGGWVPKLAVAMAVGMVMVVGAWRLSPDPSDRTAGISTGIPGSAMRTNHRPDVILRTEVAEEYRGPAADLFQPAPAQISLRYRPPAFEPMLTVFRVVALGDDGKVAVHETDTRSRPYLGAACREQCLEVDLDLDEGGGRVRLPVPTGHLLDPASLELEGRSATLWAAPDGGPLLELDTGFRGRVRYRTGVGYESQPVIEGSWPVLPVVADEMASSLRSLDPDVAALKARDWVQRRVVYDTSESTVMRHRSAARQGLGFTDRCLAVGAGDCDVQNALLATILARAGLSVRLAVGFVGADGRALPGLHAWVEYRSKGEVWRQVDASRGAVSRTSRGSPPPIPRAVEGEDRITAPADLTTSRFVFPWGGAAKILVAVALLVVGTGLILRRRVKVDRTNADDGPDLAGLLRGALARPEAYREVPALTYRRIVPILGPGTISLDRARRLARHGRLAASSLSSDLARRAANQGQAIIDASRAEGGAVAAALGAVDLDRWDGIIDRGREHPVSDRLVRSAAGAGLRWTVVICGDLVDEIVVLDGELAGLGRRRKIVAVDVGGGLWRRVTECAVERPATAVLLLADRVVERFDRSLLKTRRLLSQLAAEAVKERAEHPS